MNHQGTIRIETKNLVLRRFTTADAEAMYHNWASDDAVTKYLTWPSHASVEVTTALLQTWVEAYEQPTFYNWAITWKENEQEPIGGISIVHMDEAIASVEFGYCLGRNWWRRGITSEALQALIRFFSETVGANRLEARHDLANPNSGQVMRACGMQYEGTLRQGGRNNQGCCDEAIYALLAPAVDQNI